VTELNPQLLADLARLASRYAPADWKAIVEALEDPERRQQVALVLDELAAASGRRRAGPEAPSSKSSGDTVARSIEKVRESDPERARLLEELLLRLRAAELLPDMESLRNFAEAVGMKSFRPAKREQAINHLLRYLAELSHLELESVLGVAASMDVTRVGDYERWVELILGRGSPDGTHGEPRASAEPTTPAE
jgi:hypothetical protein